MELIKNDYNDQLLLLLIDELNRVVIFTSCNYQEYINDEPLVCINIPNYTSHTYFWCEGELHFYITSRHAEGIEISEYQLINWPQ